MQNLDYNMSIRKNVIWKANVGNRYQLQSIGSRCDATLKLEIVTSASFIRVKRNMMYFIRLNIKLKWSSCADSLRSKCEFNFVMIFAQVTLQWNYFVILMGIHCEVTMIVILEQVPKWHPDEVTGWLSDKRHLVTLLWNHHQCYFVTSWNESGKAAT